MGFRPTLPLKILDTRKLLRIGGHQNHLAAQRLAGDQQIVCSDRFSDSFYRGADSSPYPGILFFEREHGNVFLVASEESGDAMPYSRN